MTSSRYFAVGTKLLGIYFIVSSLVQFGSAAYMYLASRYPTTGWDPVYNQVTTGGLYLVAAITLIVWGNRELRRVPQGE
jgi:hypothetical protein